MVTPERHGDADGEADGQTPAPPPTKYRTTLSLLTFGFKRSMKLLLVFGTRSDKPWSSKTATAV
jgi:hypothetical protein